MWANLLSGDEKSIWSQIRLGFDMLKMFTRSKRSSILLYISSRFFLIFFHCPHWNDTSTLNSYILAYESNFGYDECPSTQLIDSNFKPFCAACLVQQPPKSNFWIREKNAVKVFNKFALKGPATAMRETGITGLRPTTPVRRWCRQIVETSRDQK